MSLQSFSLCKEVLTWCLTLNEACANTDRVAFFSLFYATPVFVLPQALYNEYVHFKETEIPAKELEKGHVEHLYKLLEVRGKGGRTMNEE